MRLRPPSPARPLAAGILLLPAGLLLGCRPGVGVSGPGHYYLAVGDTGTFRASAYTGLFFPGDAAYTSVTAPGRFRWRSSDPTVAEVSAAGLVTARAPGRARIEAETGGVRHGQELTVEPPAAALALHVSRDSVRVGDTVRLTVTALDSAGRSIRGVYVYTYLATFRARGVPTGERRNGPAVTPFGLTLRADSAGEAVIGAFRPYLHQRRDLRAQARFAVVPAARR